MTNGTAKTFTVVRGATGATRSFPTLEDATRFIRHRGDRSELWQIAAQHEAAL